MMGCVTASILALISSVTELNGAPRRLTVNGSQLIDPSGKSVRLRGFNWQTGRQQPGDGALMHTVAPGANMVRLVGVLWGNTRSYQESVTTTAAPPSAAMRSRDDDELLDDPHLLWPEEPRLGSIEDCLTESPPTYFNDKCFAELDAWVRDAAAANLWVILAVRGMYIAGQDYQDKPGTVVFRNETLRGMMNAMWTHVATHYAAFDNIAAYEILSEPRDKDIDAASVNAFYSAGCDAVQSADPRTPCIVGTAPYYKLYTFGESTLIPRNPNVIYTFDYFNPDSYVFGTSDEVAHYNQSYPCQALYKGWSQVCHTWGVKTLSDPILFDRGWHAHNVATFLTPIQQKYSVPILANQWLAVHGLTREAGRYDYMSDFMSVMESAHVSWAWWTYIGGDAGDQWKHGSSEVVYKKTDGSIMLDDDALDTMAPFLLLNGSTVERHAR
mgnify:CR=1 FL=1|jgi:hypothetical protein